MSSEGRTRRYFLLIAVGGVIGGSGAFFNRLRGRSGSEETNLGGNTELPDPTVEDGYYTVDILSVDEDSDDGTISPTLDAETVNTTATLKLYTTSSDNTEDEHPDKTEEVTIEPGNTTTHTFSVDTAEVDSYHIEIAENTFAVTVLNEGVDGDVEVSLHEEGGDLIDTKTIYIEADSEKTIFFEDISAEVFATATPPTDSDS